MHFPSDDELMAGPNAFEGVDIDSLDFPEENGDEASEEAGHADFEGADFGDSDLDEADDEIAQDVADSVDSLRQLRAETNAAADIVIPDFPEDFRAGFISIVGRPNVGKSTLTNALVGHKVAITSGRPETTRHNIRGIVHGDNYQLVLVDTPGYHRPRTLLGKRLNDMVREALAEVDCVIFCLPANQRIGPGDQFIARELRSVRRPIIAVATKCDSVPRERVLEHLMAIEKLGEWSAIIPVSSFENKGIDRLREVLAQTVPLSPPLYPQDNISDESRETMIAEFIREAALEGVRDELPHSLAVQVEEIIERPKREGDDRPIPKRPSLSGRRARV